MDGTFAYLALGALVMNVSMVTGLRPLVLPVTADSFTVASITADRVGETAVLHVSREIKQPIVMEFTMRVMAVKSDGLHQVCTAHGGPYEYQPGSVLPDPLTLDWWTDGGCKTIPPGPVRIVTTWSPDNHALKPITVITEVEG